MCVKSSIIVLLVLNIASAIAIGLLDFLFLREKIDETYLSSIRSCVYIMINVLWWCDAGFIFIALLRMRNFAKVTGNCEMNQFKLMLQLLVCCLFGVASLPICFLQVVKTVYYGKVFFICQIIETVLAGVATLIMLTILL